MASSSSSRCSADSFDNDVMDSIEACGSETDSAAPAAVEPPLSQNASDESDEDRGRTVSKAAAPTASNRQQRTVVRAVRPNSSGQSVPLCDAEEPRSSSVTNREFDWHTVPEKLRVSGLLDVHTNVFSRNYLEMPAKYVQTMDAVSKCWRTVVPRNESLLTDETEGGSWVFCERCVAQIPPAIQEILFFFHRLKASITDYKGYAIPSKSVTLVRTPGNKNVVSQIVWHRMEESRGSRGDSDGSDDEMDINSILGERAKDSSGEVKFQIEPIKIRLGFTGALFTRGQPEEAPNPLDKDKEGPHDEAMTFAVLAVTWARNFDMLTYIKEVFLKPPKLVTQWADHENMVLLWKKMQRYVAFRNLGLDESRFGDPDQYSEQPGGVLGVDSLFNVFQIPFQIYGIIKQIVGGRAARVRIVGMPVMAEAMTFRKSNAYFTDYVQYMHWYVNELANERQGYRTILRKLNKPKDKDSPEEAEAAAYDLANPGAWPLSRHPGGEYTRFGLPPLPIWLKFAPEYNPSAATTQEMWFATIGGADGLPELTKMCLRTFLVRSQDTAGWDQFLLDTRKANSLLVLQHYYDEESDPLAGLVPSGSMRSWWVSIQNGLKTLRESGGSVEEACSRLHAFWGSVGQQHVSSIDAGVYRSARVKQGLYVLNRLDFDGVVNAGTSSIWAFSGRLTAAMPKGGQFNGYQRANEAFYSGWAAANEGLQLNSNNLALVIEMMISQLMWTMGEHNATFPAFFQGIHVMSGNGHFKITLKGVTHTVGCKANSAGMDFCVTQIVMLAQMLLDRAGITNTRDNLQAPVNLTNFTPVSLQLNTCATIRNGKLQQLPANTLSHQSMVMTEFRNSSFNDLIKGVFPRHRGGQRQVNTNTCDDATGSNLREGMERVRIYNMHFCALSTNERNHEEEQRKTLGVVTARMPGGSGPHVKKRRTGDFNDATNDTNAGRQDELKEKDATVNLLQYTHVFAGIMPALLNHTSVVPYEINPAVLGMLDWVSFWLKEHAGGVMEQTVYESYKRIREGYESRQVAKSLWTTCIMLLPGSSDVVDAMLRVAQAMHVNAMPLVESVPAMHSFFTRGAHMGCLLMIGVIAKHLEVPVIPLEQLKRFFSPPQVI